MKRLFVLVFVLLILTSCKAKPEAFFNIQVGEDLLICGYDSADVLEGKEYLNSYSTFFDKKDREFIESFEIYKSDVNDYLALDGIVLKPSIRENCERFQGEIIEKNGYACLLHKTVKKKENYVLMYGNILNDDMDLLDRIEVYYKEINKGEN